MSNSFYIPIQSMNLAHYLGSGIIVPSIYIENKNADIQDRFKNYLLLSSSKFTKDTNCAIEIVLNNNEEAPKKISEHFYLFDMPLPISRIKNIYFTNEEQKVNTNFNIATGSAFIPEGLLKVSQEESIETKELENIDTKELENIVEYKSSEKKWSEYLKKYDQVLGGFSTMKISKENFQNYPTHYFSALGNINTLFSNTLAKQNIAIENSFQFAFTDEGKFKNFHNTIYSEIDYNEVQRYAENDKVKLDVKNGLVQIDKIAENTQTYLVAILESYGKGKRKQVDSFISDLVSGKFIEKKKEGLSLIFGLNKGYKAFRNKYKTANFEADIKFHLDSKLDYYIIESIYQNVFNSLNNILSFKYIDSLFSETKTEEVKNSNYITYQMIDETIIWKQRVLTPIEKLLAKITEIVSKWFPSFLQVKKNEIELLFKSEIEHFKTEVENELKTNHKVEIEQLNKYISEKDNSINQLNIETEKLRVESDQRNVEIEKLNNQILENDNLIAQLNQQIVKNIKSKFENVVNEFDIVNTYSKVDTTDGEVKIENTESNVDNTDNEVKIGTKESKVEDSDNEIKVENKEELAETENIESNISIEDQNSSTLFSYDNISLRELELKNMSEENLKSIAKKYKITKRKPEIIIAEIIKYESKK